MMCIPGRFPWVKKRKCAWDYFIQHAQTALPSKHTCCNARCFCRVFNSACWKVFQPIQWPESERQNTLDFYTALWVNVLLMLDICPRKVTNGTEDTFFFCLSKLQRHNWFSIQDWWIMNSQTWMVKKTRSRKKLNPHTEYLPKTAKVLDMRIIDFKTWEIKDSTWIHKCRNR